MDRLVNPFAPGAGTPPPELAGRAALLDSAKLALQRVKLGRSERSQLLLGLRGVGKTVLLNRIEELAQAENYVTISLEAQEGRRLAQMLVPPLRKELIRLSRTEQTWESARRGLAILRAFSSAFKVTVADVEFGVDADFGVADSGDFEADLPELLLAVARAAQAGGRAVALLIDEVQYLSEVDLSALIASLHKLGQKALPFIVFGAGLPQLAGLAGEAKSYAERLFTYPDVGPLPADAARDALRLPIDRSHASIDEDALALIVEKTEGYPYFLQVWGSHAWNEAERAPISLAAAARATVAALADLDASFFRVRLDRLTPREMDYVRAMAELGGSKQRSGQIAKTLGLEVTHAGPLRQGLIKKGMIYSPKHGDTAFTVPMFDGFLHRTMPDWRPPHAKQRR